MKTPLLPLLLAAGALSAQELTVTPVTGGIHMINGRGGNVGVCAGDDGLLLIDAKFARLAKPMRAALAGLGEGGSRLPPQHPLPRRPHRRQPPSSAPSPRSWRTTRSAPA